VSLVLALCVLEVSAGQSTGNWLKSTNPTLAQYDSVFEGKYLGTTAAPSDADLQKAFVSMKIKKPHRRVIVNASKIPAEAVSTSEDRAPAETKPTPKKETKSKVDKVVAQTTTAAKSKDLDFAAGGEAMVNYHDPLVRRVAADTAILPKRTYAPPPNSYQGYECVPEQQGCECERIEMPESEVIYKECILKREPVVIVASPDDDSIGYLGWKTHKWLDFGYLKLKAGDVEVLLIDCAINRPYSTHTLCTLYAYTVHTILIHYTASLQGGNTQDNAGSATIGDRFSLRMPEYTCWWRCW
jgi:hypothetical protein